MHCCFLLKCPIHSGVERDLLKSKWALVILRLLLTNRAFLFFILDPLLIQNVGRGFYLVALVIHVSRSYVKKQDGTVAQKMLFFMPIVA